MPRHCSLIHDTIAAECVKAYDSHDDSNSTTTQSMSSSSDEIFYDHTITIKNDDDLHMNDDLKSVSTMSYSTQNWKNTVILSSNDLVSDYDNHDTFGVARSVTSTIDTRRSHFLSVSCCGIRLRRSSKISKSSSKILELPRDAEFDSSCDSSLVNDDNDDDENNVYQQQELDMDLIVFEV